MEEITTPAPSKNQRFLRRLSYAWAGIVLAVRSEASLRTQLVLGAVALGVLIMVKTPVIWLALCILCAGAVLALELINTALERLADRLHPERHEAIRCAKDCAAGAVLVASVTAVVVAGLAVAVNLGWL